MQTEAAVLWERHAEWSVEPIELDPPKEGEVLIRLAASGMCHSDEHLVTGDMPVPLPVIGGHEGAGVVEEVGPGVTRAAARATTSSSASSPPAGSARRAPPGTPTSATSAPRSWRAGRWTARSATTPAGRTSPPWSASAPSRQLHRGQPGLVRQDPRRHPARQGLPGRVRRHHGLGFRRLRRRGAAGRQRRRHRRRGHRCVRAPGCAAGRRRDDLRHRPRRAQAHAGPDLRGHPRGPVGRGGARAHRAGDLGPHVRQGHLRHGRRVRGDDGVHPGPHRQARPGRRHQHPPHGRDGRDDEPHVPDDPGEAGRRAASSGRPTSTPTSPSCSSSTATASSTSTP